ncbi:MAG: helix-turn-helix transcriptional regulator [Terrimicrobiaceae bacterium]
MNGEWKRLLGVRIRESRVLNGLTQQELAARLRRGGFRRCSRALLSQIETGVATIRGHEIYYLRKVFGKDFESEFWKPFHHRRAPARKR